MTADEYLKEHDREVRRAKNGNLNRVRNLVRDAVEKCSTGPAPKKKVAKKEALSD